MINAGITGGETLAAGELIRILINHPDVNLISVASDVYPGRAVTDVHRGLEGDTDLCFTHRISDRDSRKMNLVFLCGEPWQAERFMESLGDLRRETDEPLRIIDLTGYFRLHPDDSMVYGMPEQNRKALVRGATRAVIPSAGAMALELALFPFAKGALLQGDLRASLEIASTEHFVRESLAPGASADLSTRLDPVAPAQYRSDNEAIAKEVEGWLRTVQPSFHGRLSLTISRTQEPRGVTAAVSVPTTLATSDVRHLFDEAYDDHSFTYPVDRRPDISEVANTNKCLIEVTDAPAVFDAAGSTASAVAVRCVTDNLLKGCAGNAVHCMNLLFGLSERTGLALKASAF